MATILLLSGPNLNLLGTREPAHLRDRHARRLRGDARAAAEAHGHTLEHVAVEPRGRPRRRDPGCARALRSDRRQPRCVHPLLVRDRRRARRVRRRQGRAAPVEPRVTRGVAAYARWSRPTSPGRSPASAGPATASPSTPPRRDWRSRRDRPARDGRRRRGPDASRAGFADAGVDALDRHPPAQRPLPDRVHRVGRRWSRSRPRGSLLVTDGRYAEQSRAQIAAADVDAQVVVGATHADQLGALADFVAGPSPPRARGRRGHVGPAARLRRRASTAHELVPTTDLVEAVRAGQGAGRGRPDPGRVRDRRRRARRAAARPWPTDRPSGTSRSRSRSGCVAGAPPR